METVPSVAASRLRAQQRRERIGVNIRRARLARARMKQTDLAQQVGVAQSTISRLERGQVDSTVTRLSRIADVLDVTLADLVRGA